MQALTQFVREALNQRCFGAFCFCVQVAMAQEKQVFLAWCKYLQNSSKWCIL